MSRFNYPSIDGTINSNLSEKDRIEKQQLQDLLWSDPHVNIYDLTWYYSFKYNHKY